MIAIRCILVLLAILLSLLTLQAVTAGNASTRLRFHAVESWAGESEVRKAYGEALVADCGGGLTLVLERREKAANPNAKTCTNLLAKTALTQQIGLTAEDVAPLESLIDAAYAKHPIPAPLSWF